MLSSFRWSLEWNGESRLWRPGRNDRSSSRRSAVYAANSIGNAARFLVSEPDKERRTVQAYEVEVTHQSPSPMVLIGFIDAHGPAFSSLSACIEEYWTPNKEWRFLEFICPSLTVTAVLGNVCEEQLWMAGEDYEHDRQLARHRWGLAPQRRAEQK